MIYGYTGCIVCLGCWCFFSFIQPACGAGDIGRTKPHVCRSLDIRNKVNNFHKLENCTVIEGYLKILLIDRADPEEYANLHFPKLVEITGYLLLYRVFGLKTLRHIFPNLAVIRGQELFFNYALVAFEMTSLEEIGLAGLTTILRGAVRLEKNPKLCYIHTIDWSLIVDNASPEDHFFVENRNTDDCVNVCPKSGCSSHIVNDESRPMCWTSSDCQQVCPSGCPTKYCSGTTCCDPECIGGCYGPGPTQCIACKNFYYQGRCQARCPASTYAFWGRRCIKEKECREMGNNRIRFIRWKTFKGTCIKECPPGYTEDERDIQKCKKCQGPCPKVCSGAEIDSIATAQRLKGCTVIDGSLKIQIRGGKNIAKELEDNLGLIEVVTQFVKVARSHALISLNFLRSLKVIQGKQLYVENYSLFVVDNQNLQEIWNFTTHPNLTIGNGNIFFHFNRKLCLDKIYRLARQVGITNPLPKDISPKTNGDQIACNISKLQMTVAKVESAYAIIKWNAFVSIADQRELIGYTVYYREAPQRNLSIYSERDACGNDMVVWTMDPVIVSWKMEDILETSPYVYHILTDLKAWTQYAVYVSTYTVASSNEGAMSELLYFKTDPDVPTHPRDMVVDSRFPGELHVRWKAPTKPNGNVTHYYVYWLPQAVKREEYDRRDYCTDKLRYPKKSLMTVKENKKANTTLSDKCCACPKTEQEKRVEEEERDFQIEFENYLHNYVYQKRPVRPSGRSSSFSKRQRRFVPDIQTTLPHNSKNNSLIADGNGTSADEDEEEDDDYMAAIVYSKQEIILSNLHHFQTYSIEVVACQEYDPKEDTKLCSNRAIITATTLPSMTADNIDPKNVTITTSPSASGALIQWPDPVSPNGLIVTYDLEYSRNNVGNIKPTTICLIHKQYRLKYGYELKFETLPPGNYTFRLRATSLAGNGTWTPKMYFYRPDSTIQMDGLSQSVTIALISVSILVFVFLVSSVIICFVIKKRHTGMPDNIYISVNPEYCNTENLYEADEWEVDRDKIKLIRELGQGSFGMVYEGIGSSLFNTKGEVRVAVKTVNESASIRERHEFLNEASVMKAFVCNHVVKLMGVVSKGQPTLVIMELMAKGDLKNFLRMHRPDSEDNQGRQPPSLKRILQMAGEIADGMAYLAAKKFVHRDLAARNCMVAEDLTVKIGDFGMTRDVYETDYYKKGGKGVLPVRWMAPESLKDGIFTSTSDVWSYGVVLWEMATLAAQPYQGLSNEEVLKYVIDEGLMEKPEGCPEKIYDLMKLCWKYQPKQRPTFSEIIEILVPDLSPLFSEVSYFYSEANRTECSGETDESCPLTDDVEHGAVSLNGLRSEQDASTDPEMGLSCNHISNSSAPPPPYSPNSNYNPVSPSKQRRPEDCAFNQNSLPMSASFHKSNVSSPCSSDGSKSDGSKASVRSSGSAYSHMNGVANGHITTRFT